MRCQICHIEFETDDRLTVSMRSTFVFKPAHVPDTINAATASPNDLLESRKDHVKTEIATQYLTYGRAQVPEGAFNIRHASCHVEQTGSISGPNAMTKHLIRYARSIIRGRH